MKSAPISGASEKPASVSSGMRARRAFSVSAHSAAPSSASMLVSFRRRADQPQELRLQVFLLDTQAGEIDPLLNQPPRHLLRVRNRVGVGKTERPSHPARLVPARLVPARLVPARLVPARLVPGAPIDHETSRVQRRA